MKDKIVLITGADGGIGRETTKGIARKGARIIMACINKEEALPVCEEIKRDTGNNDIEIMEIDLSRLDSVRHFADDFSKKFDHLDVLINNAGIFTMERKETADGFELTMGINYFGPFLLTNLLLPLLKKSHSARIVNVSSNAFMQGKINIDDINMKKGFQGFKAYSASKYAVVLFTRELAERLKGSNVTVNAVHPGHVATNIWTFEKGYMAYVSKILKRFMATPEEGAKTSIYVATSEEVEGISGEYFEKCSIKD
ncbi:MAG: SDR family oxidoreductase, partial [Candidatus Schekmanbacteria bacterium]